MAASATDYFKKVGKPGSATTLAAPGHTIGGTSITVASTTNWPTGTGVTFAIDVATIVGGSEQQTAGTYTLWNGVVTSATTIGSMTLHADSPNSDQNYAAGSLTRVYIPVSSGHTNTLMDGILVHADQDGTLKAGAVDASAVIASGVITETKMSTDFLHGSDGYIDSSQTWTYVSATSFKVSGTDVTSQFPVGTKIKLTQTTAKYFYVTGATFSTDTTVTVTGGSDYTLANAAITSPMYSYLETPQGFPDWFNYTPTWANLTVGNATVTALFSMRGKTVTGTISYIHGSTSTMSTNPTFTLPITASSRYSNTYSLGTVYMEDNGVAGYWGFFRGANTTTAFPTAVGTASTYAGNGGMSSTIPFTWGTGDYMHGTFIYQAA